MELENFEPRSTHQSRFLTAAQTSFFQEPKRKQSLTRRPDCLISSSGRSIWHTGPVDSRPSWVSTICATSLKTFAQGRKWNSTCSHIKGVKEEIVTYEL